MGCSMAISAGTDRSQNNEDVPRGRSLEESVERGAERWVARKDSVRDARHEGRDVVPGEGSQLSVSDSQRRGYGHTIQQTHPQRGLS